MSFESGLHAQFPEFMDCVRSSVHGCGKPFKVIAADLDMSSSELSRKLAGNPNDPVHIQLRHFTGLMRSTGDLRPLYWLIEEFCEDEGRKRQRIQHELSSMLPRLEQLLAEAGGRKA